MRDSGNARADLGERFLLVYLAPMSIAGPHSHTPETDEGWVKITDGPTLMQMGSELRAWPNDTGFIAPKVLFFFRYGALLTVLTGLTLSIVKGYGHRALTLNGATASENLIGLGMWLALIMAFNVWFIIWPNQKKALGIVTVEAPAKAAAARLAMLASRFNTMLSVPMLFCMVAQQNGGL